MRRRLAIVRDGPSAPFLVRYSAQNAVAATSAKQVPLAYGLCRLLSGHCGKHTKQLGHGFSEHRNIRAAFRIHRIEIGASCCIASDCAWSIGSNQIQSLPIRSRSASRSAACYGASIHCRR